ncbi:MAG: YicC/YloC family endoribonuclease [Spirochaetota bacterium]
MTGYGHGEHADDGLSLSVEIKGYNNRYLDVNLNLPSALGGFEAMVREQVSAVVERGRVDVYVRYHDANDTPKINFSPATVNAVAEGLRELAHAAGISAEVRLDHLLRLEGVVSVERPEAGEAIEGTLRRALEAGLETFDASRIREGEAMFRDIMENVEAIRVARDQISGYAPSIEAQIQGNLKERFVDLLGEEADLSRVYAETAVQLTKATISEELVRMEAHLDAFRTIAGQRGSIGKKLDFLSQELNREINTIGSKNVLTEIGALVVEVKDRIEKVREQLRNVE